MAAALQCEICGGKLIGKPGGIFECDSCGMEYNTEWAKAKIQEIKVTVKVEGTVEVTGKVQVEGNATTESLLKRGFMALEDEHWDEAQKLFSRIIEADPENADAYLGRAMAKNGCRDREALRTKYLAENARNDIASSRDITRARQFSRKLEIWLRSLDAEKQVRKNKRLAQEKAKLSQLPAIRKKHAVASGFISAGRRHTVGMFADGTAVATGDNYFGQCEVFGWTDLISVSAGDNFTLGLRSNGTVLATGSNQQGSAR